LERVLERTMHDRVITKSLPVPLVFRIIAYYIVLSGLWIVFSDRLVAGLISDPILLKQIQTYKGWAFVLASTGLLYLLLRHHLKRSERVEEALRLIMEGTSSVVGEDFFRSLVRHMAAAMKVRWAFVSQLAGSGGRRIRLMAFWAGNDFTEDIEYEAKDTPCEKVIGKAFCFYPSGVRKLFPKDDRLGQEGVESYLALPLFDSSGNPLGHLGVMHDRPIREASYAESILKIFASRVVAELERERSLSLLRATLDSTADGILVVDLDGRIVGYNKMFVKMWRVPESMIASGDDRQAIEFVLDQLQRPEQFYAKVKELYAQPERESFDVLEFKDGRVFERSSQPQQVGNRIVGRVWSFHDVTERIQAEAQIRNRAYYDQLTGLPNRTLFYDRLKQSIKRSRREGISLGVIMMDLDRFKEINDTFGHPRGDQVLQEIARRLNVTVRESDTVARFEGDVFSMILVGTDRKGCERVVRTFLKAMEESFNVEGLGLAVEASFGIAIYPDHGEDPDKLIRCADVAMHMAKETGSGYFIYSSDTDRHTPRRLALLGGLRHAIDRNELLLHYQPKVCMRSGRFSGTEALLRWHHPEFGMVPPIEFIIPAEQTGLMKPLTLWILNRALRQCQSMKQEGIKMSVAVNLSRRSLHDPETPDMVREVLKGNWVGPECLELEITESAIMVDPVRAIEILNRLNQMGVRLSIDDFGTGYSSLASLKKLPVHEIKIDQSFIKELAVREEDARIVKSAIDLAHGLGLKVVAEGVEDKETWDRLVELGCDSAQGYYMSRPIPLEELRVWLRESPWGIKKGRRHEILQ